MYMYVLNLGHKTIMAVLKTGQFEVINNIIIIIIILTFLIFFVTFTAQIE